MLTRRSPSTDLSSRDAAKIRRKVVERPDFEIKLGAAALWSQFKLTRHPDAALMIGAQS
jgi:hypothetical protein